MIANRQRSLSSAQSNEFLLLKILVCTATILLSPIAFSNLSLAQEVDAERMAKDSAPDDAEEVKPEEEAPPPAEAPYPNAKTEETAGAPPVTKPPVLAPPISKPSVQKSLGKPQTIRATGKQIPLNLDKPKKIDENGTYIYEKSNKTNEVDVSKQPTPPNQYGKEGRLNITPPLKLKKNGDYFYGYERSPHNRSASIKFGVFPAPALTNPKSGASFKQLYTANAVGSFMFDYERQFHRSIGDLGLRFGSGIFFQNGTGRFVNQADTERDPATVPDLSFNFVMFPNTLTALYHMRYSENQIFTPYFGGGAGYFLFTEIRDDNRAPKFAGAAVGVGVGGINIMIDGIDSGSARELEANYGISHVALSFEFTQFLGINRQYDFTGSVLNAGFNLEF